MRQPVIAGNWKMYKTSQEGMALVEALLAKAPAFVGVEVVVCPPFTALAGVGWKLKGGTAIALGAQNCHWESQGAFTGEIAPPMLKELGCAYVILGHSERRQYFGETDANIQKKALACLAIGLKPIVCVGETLAQRQANDTWPVIERQLRDSLAGFTAPQIEQTVIAYEPVWAIGTGQNATPAQAQDVHAQIRAWLGKTFGQAAAERVRIQYGGSVKPENALTLMQQPDIDGGLIGGASLQVDSFLAIIQAAAQAKPTTQGKGATCCSSR